MDTRHIKQLGDAESALRTVGFHVEFNPVLCTGKRKVSQLTWYFPYSRADKPEVEITHLLVLRIALWRGRVSLSFFFVFSSTQDQQGSEFSPPLQSQNQEKCGERGRGSKRSHILSHHMKSKIKEDQTQSSKAFTTWKLKDTNVTMWNCFSFYDKQQAGHSSSFEKVFSPIPTHG